MFRVNFPSLSDAKDVTRDYASSHVNGRPMHVVHARRQKVIDILGSFSVKKVSQLHAEDVSAYIEAIKRISKERP